MKKIIKIFLSIFPEDLKFFLSFFSFHLFNILPSLLLQLKDVMKDDIPRKNGTRVIKY